jgi:Ca2+-binding RTX toxin-like protein
MNKTKKDMKKTVILGTMAAMGWLGTMGNGIAGEENSLIARPTSPAKIQYDPKANLLTVEGGNGDDRIEVALAEDGDVFLNGISLAKLGIRLEGVPLVAIQGGAGNDILIARRLPLAAMNGGDGKDILAWDNGDCEFERTTYGEDVLIWNQPVAEGSYGGVGLDILIANTGEDRLDDEPFGDLGNDWISGGTGRDSVYDGYGRDLLLGGDGDTLK